MQYSYISHIPFLSPPLHSPSHSTLFSSENMLPITESIFNVGEEGTTEESNKSTIISSSCRRPPESLVGLQILIQHHRQASNIVVKSALKSCELNSVGSRRRIPKSWPELGFLKACLFCKKELSLEKDVYMYRGDQGFCSEECRSQQILLDERREFEASKREWQRIQRRQNSAMPKIREYSDRRRRITIGA